MIRTAFFCASEQNTGDPAGVETRIMVKLAEIGVEIHAKIRQFCSRSPHGERGLKYLRRAGHGCGYVVAPPTGSVD